jgi:biotin transport system substrate-specific component
MTTSNATPRTYLSLRDMMLVSMFTAILGVLAYVVIPLPFSPVPVTGQTFGIMLVGLLLGRKRGVMSVLLMIALGAIGIPVFSGGRAGFGVLVGPTGGYIFSWILSVVVTDWLYSRIKGLKGAVVAAFAGGVAVVYAIGVPWLALSTGMTLSAAVTAGALPFLPGDLFKVAAAALTAQRMPEKVIRG